MNRELSGTIPRYTGEMNEAMPMPIPLTTLAAINHLTVGARAVPRALAVKIIPASMIILRDESGQSERLRWSRRQRHPPKRN